MISRSIQLLEELNTDELITIILYLSSKEDASKKWGKRVKNIFRYTIVIILGILFALDQGQYVHVKSMFSASISISVLALLVIGMIWFHIGKSLFNIRICKGIAIQIVEERRKKAI